MLDARPRVQSLEMLSHYLTEFQYSKFDDIEIPGQYTEVFWSLSRADNPITNALPGQGRQLELCTHRQIRTAIRELPRTRPGSEEVHNGRPEQFRRILGCSATGAPLLAS